MSVGVDILIFAAVAGYLAFKLYNVLGRKEDDTQDIFKHYTAHDLGIIPTTDDQEALDEPELEEESLDDLPESTQHVVTTIKSYDASFRYDTFVNNAQQAFDVILTAFAEEDVDTLRSLLSPDILDVFESAIAQRQEAGEQMDLTLISVKAAVLSAEIEQDVASFTLEFVSEQIQAIRSRDDSENLLSGSTTHIETITDIWTFSHNLNAKHPVWVLSATDEAPIDSD